MRERKKENITEKERKSLQFERENYRLQLLYDTCDDVWLAVVWCGVTSLPHCTVKEREEGGGGGGG